MDAAEAKAAAEKARPLLKSRNDALALVQIGENVTDISDARQLWDKFGKADFNKFTEAIAALKKALFKERDEYGIVTPSWDLEKIDAAKKAFDEVAATFPSALQAVLRVKVHRNDPEAKVDKAVRVYENHLLEKKETPKPKEVKEPAPKEDTGVVPYTPPEQPKGKPITDKTKWPTSKSSPGVKRLPAQKNQEEWLKMAPAISEMLHSPNGEGKSLSEDDVDNILIYLDNNDASEEEFLAAAHKILPEYYDVEKLDKEIKELKEDMSDNDNSANELAELEQQHNRITKMDGNLKFIYQHWTPMETKSNLIKNINSNQLTLGERKITLMTPEITASIKFASTTEACEKFLELNTEADVEATFSVAALLALEKEAAGGMESLIKPDTKGPSAEEEKPLVTAMVEWLNASNIQGSEADVEKKAADYLASKAPDYDEANVQRVARKVYAEWTASKKVPGAVGQEGKAGMGVANIDGTGVFVEPQRGDTNVQNESPTGDQRGNVRKEAMLSFRSSLEGEVKTSDDLNLFATLDVVSFVEHIPGHKNSKGEAAPWVIKSHETQSILSSHATEGEAKKHLQQMHMFKSMKGASMNPGDLAILNTQVGELLEGTEVEVVVIADDSASFVSGTTSGITKLANLDKVTLEKYPWDNDGLAFKFCLGDRVKVGSIEHNGESWKGEEGTVREKVVLATNGEVERFYLVELDCGGNETLPEESLSKAGKKKEAALNAEELTKVAVIKPNFDAVQEFLKSYDNPPSVVTTDDIEHWMGDEKNNYQYSKKDLKEFVKYLESAHVEVRVPAKKKVPEVLPGEAGEMGNTEAEEAAEFAPPKEMLKEAVKYKSISPDGKSTTEKDIEQDMGAEFDTDDPTQPGQKVKWTRESSLDVCSKCAGQGSLPCPCMDGELWLSTSCNKCKDEGSVPCSCKQPA